MYGFCNVWVCAGGCFNCVGVLVICVLVFTVYILFRVCVYFIIALSVLV